MCNFPSMAITYFSLIQFRQHLYWVAQILFRLTFPQNFPWKNSYPKLRPLDNCLKSYFAGFRFLPLYLMTVHYCSAVIDNQHEGGFELLWNGKKEDELHLDLQWAGVVQVLKFLKIEKIVVKCPFMKLYILKILKFLTNRKKSSLLSFKISKWANENIKFIVVYRKIFCRNFKFRFLNTIQFVPKSIPCKLITPQKLNIS